MEDSYARNKLIEVIREKGISENFLNLPGVVERIVEDGADMLEKRIITSPNKNINKGEATSFVYSTSDDKFMKFAIMLDGHVAIDVMPRQSNKHYPREIIRLNDDGIDVRHTCYKTPDEYSVTEREENGIIDKKEYVQGKRISTSNTLDVGNWRLLDSNGNALGIPLLVNYETPGKQADSRFENPPVMGDSELEAVIRNNSNKVASLYPSTREYFERLIPVAKQSYKDNMLVISPKYRERNNRENNSYNDGEINI